MEPILDALRELDVIRAVSKGHSEGGDELGLHWKLTLNHYKQRDVGEKLDGGALFPWQ